MNDVLVTCIKNGRFDRFGRPLVSGLSYTLQWGLARDLWLAGYVSVTDSSVFDASSVDIRRPNLAAELAAIGIYSGYSESTSAPMGGPGAGMGICNPEYVPAGLTGLSGYTDRMHANFGNYIHPASGSIMCFIPRYWYKWGTGSNGLAVNQCSIVQHQPGLQDFLIASGYTAERAFWDGGAIKSGVFVDKYMCSNNGGIAASIKNGNPLSSNSAHNPFASLNGSPANAYYGAVDAAKTRGSQFFCSSRFIFAALARLSYAHGQQSPNTTYCAWYDATNNFPKGCNNDALRDSQDATVLYTSDGYLNCGKTGSAVPFEKTTHNGQACGVADLNGLLFEVNLGLTSDGTAYYAVKTSVAMSSLTSGNTLATDAWGATGIAANYDSIGATYGALQNSASTKSFGNAAQVFSESASGTGWTATGLGIPLVGGVGGTNAFGYDALYDHRPADMIDLSGGAWSNLSAAGVWALNIAGVRGSSSSSVGFRCAIYPTT
jgi:hypothetical protein